MTKKEKDKAIFALKISTPRIAYTCKELSEYIHILNKIENWLEQLQEIEEIIKSWKDGTIEEKDSIYAFHKIVKALEKQITEQDSRWVLVEKRSDPDYDWEFHPQCGEYKEVIAWMPLPEKCKP